MPGGGDGADRCKTATSQKDLQLKYLEPPQLGVTFQVVGHIFTPVMNVGKIGLIVGIHFILIFRY